MSLEYAPRGLVGMLTPQANTTVEPEFNLLWPPGVAMINARLMSDKASMSAARLVDYFDNYGASLRQFANAPVVSSERPAPARCICRARARGRAVADIDARSGHPFMTAALAVVDALTALEGAPPGPRVALSRRCSMPRALPIGKVMASKSRRSPTRSTTKARFIRSTAWAARAAAQALSTLEQTPLDAIIMLGTGMPTLQPIAGSIGWRGAR